MGNTKLLNNFSISIVGARNAYEESRIVAEDISYNLSLNNVQIISGMALGVDSVAHNACLKAKGKTIAILGSGFNNIYPKENIELFYKIIEEGGLVITEYDTDVPALPYNFLNRNRIVAALSSGTVLVQAREKSGSITTAKYVLKLKRDLFVVLGSALDVSYKGSNKLLTKGAKCVLNHKDILREYKNFSNNIVSKDIVKKQISIPKEYEDIYKFISNRPKTINQISIETGVSINILGSKLTLMEMEGYIKAMPGKCFIKCY